MVIALPPQHRVNSTRHLCGALPAGLSMHGSGQAALGAQQPPDTLVESQQRHLFLSISRRILSPTPPDFASPCARAYAFSLPAGVRVDGMRHSISARCINEPQHRHSNPLSCLDERYLHGPFIGWCTLSSFHDVWQPARAGICGAIPAGLSVDGIRAGSATLQQPRQPASFGDTDYELFLRSLSTPCPGARLPPSALPPRSAAMPLAQFPYPTPASVPLRLARVSLRTCAQLLDFAFRHLMEVHAKS